MRPFSSWPLVSALCVLAVSVVTSVLPESGDDEGHALPPLTTKSVEQAAYYGCSDEEIANLFVISVSYLLDRYGVNLAFMRARRSYELRKAQFELATKKANGSMLTWLGRNELHQSLSPEHGNETFQTLPPKVG